MRQTNVLHQMCPILRVKDRLIDLAKKYIAQSLAYKNLLITQSGIEFLEFSKLKINHTQTLFKALARSDDDLSNHWRQVNIFSQVNPLLYAPQLTKSLEGFEELMLSSSDADLALKFMFSFLTFLFFLT